MTRAGYSVYLVDQFGNFMADASNFLRLDYARTVNTPGALTLELPGGYPLSAIVIPDGRVEVWRRLESGREYLDTDAVWLIRALRQRIGDNGLRSIVVEADHPLSLLGEPGRFVDAFAGSSEAEKTAAADDMCKTIVREQAGTEASDITRSFVPYVTVAADAGAAPSITKAFAWRPVLDVLQEIVQDAAEQGTYLAFDIVAITSQELEFQTFVGQRGADRRLSSLSPLLIGPDFGNVAECELTIDYREEVTYALAGGSGEESARLTGEYTDTERTARSPLGRREVFVNASNTDTAAALTAEARSRVRAGRPRYTLSGKLISTPSAQYGEHWQFGDYVTVQAFGQQFDCRLDAIHVTVSGQAEQVEAVLNGETYG